MTQRAKTLKAILTACSEFNPLNPLSAVGKTVKGLYEDELAEQRDKAIKDMITSGKGVTEEALAEVLGIREDLQELRDTVLPFIRDAVNVLTAHQEEFRLLVRERVPTECAVTGFKALYQRELAPCHQSGLTVSGLVAETKRCYDSVADFISMLRRAGIEPRNLDSAGSETTRFTTFWDRFRLAYAPGDRRKIQNELVEENPGSAVFWELTEFI